MRITRPNRRRSPKSSTILSWSMSIRTVKGERSYTRSLGTGSPRKIPLIWSKLEGRLNSSTEKSSNKHKLPSSLSPSTSSPPQMLRLECPGRLLASTSSPFSTSPISWLFEPWFLCVHVMLFSSSSHINLKPGLLFPPPTRETNCSPQRWNSSPKCKSFPFLVFFKSREMIDFPTNIFSWFFSFSLTNSNRPWGKWF